jgi:hypothetical protein
MKNILKLKINAFKIQIKDKTQTSNRLQTFKIIKKNAKIPKL